MQLVVKKRRYVTLIEMLIVIFLIGLIGGVVAINLAGTFEKGKAAATRIGIQKVEEYLSLAVAENPSSLENIESNWEEVIRKSPYVKDPSAFVKDGWGFKYDVEVENGNIVVTSRKFEEYKRAHPNEYPNE